jgi:hypothetical protein
VDAGGRIELRQLHDADAHQDLRRCSPNDESPGDFSGAFFFDRSRIQPRIESEACCAKTLYSSLSASASLS